MAIVNRMIETANPHGGLGPKAHNIPALWVGFPAASASNNVYTTANHFTNTLTAGTNYTMAPGTNIDYARNVVALFSPNTASTALYSAGTLILYGKDYYNNEVSESKAVSDIVSANTVWRGSVNFQRLDTIMVSSLQFGSSASSARSAVSLYVGQGQKLGLPVSIQASAGAVQAVNFGTAQHTTVTATASTSNNQFTVVTGAHSIGGISMSTALASGTLLQIHYKMNGRSVPYEPGLIDMDPRY
jgi:hypothetical protein